MPTVLWRIDWFPDADRPVARSNTTHLDSTSCTCGLPAGTEPKPDGTDPDAANLKVFYGITPVDDHATLDFWAVARDFAIDDADVGSFLRTMNSEVVLQDVRALGLIEQRLGDDWSPPEVSLKIDTGGLAARRILAGMI